MIETSIQHVHADNGTLNAEHYQTFEMAKANDDILGGDNIAEIRSYAAYARAQAQAIHKTIAATNGIDDVAAIKAEATETAQTFAKVGIYADQRIGEILRELPKAKNQYGEKLVDTPTSTRQAEREANIDHHTAIDFQAMAANPEVVEAVIAKAEEEGRIVSRSQVLKAIKEKQQAESERDRFKVQRDATMLTLEEAYQTNELLETEIASLKKSKPAPEVIEREVEVVREVVPDDVQKRIEWLEHLEKIHSDDDQKLRRSIKKKNEEIERLKVLLDGKNHLDNASWDISVLTTATNNYLSQYGGKAWAFDQFDHADEVTQQEFIRAMTSLAAFSQNLIQMINGKGNKQ